jgi:hypothetical protein
VAYSTLVRSTDNMQICEAVAQIMDARPAAMPVEPLWRPQSESLEDEREVVASVAVADASASITDEKGFWGEAVAN